MAALAVAEGVGAGVIGSAAWRETGIAARTSQCQREPYVINERMGDLS
jgi:hypothetical protein